MDRARVKSSNIVSIGYDVDSQILEVEFKKNSVYQYFDVPENEYTELMDADSHGKYLNSNIKDNYKYEQIS